MAGTVYGAAQGSGDGDADVNGRPGGNQGDSCRAFVACAAVGEKSGGGGRPAGPPAAGGRRRPLAAQFRQSRNALRAERRILQEIERGYCAE